LVVQGGASRTSSEFAKYTAEKFGALTHADGPVYRAVGGLEIATTELRLAELRRASQWARSWGIEATLLEPAECERRYPLLGPNRVLGGLHTPSDGVVDTSRAAEAQARAAMARGATFLPHKEVLEILGEAGQVTGVRTAVDIVDADIVVCAAGLSTARLGRPVGLNVPLVPTAHIYATTGPLSEVVELPVLRHRDHGLYFRPEPGNRLGIGVLGGSISFPPALKQSVDLLPGLGGMKLDAGYHGTYAVTHDGLPIIGRHRDLAGLWVAEAFRAAHSAGVARAAAQWIVEGSPQSDVSECDVSRFASGWAGGRTNLVPRVRK
jgi:glycine/D-amino acid oxidase-like deaminating enzyme